MSGGRITLLFVALRLDYGFANEILCLCEWFVMVAQELLRAASLLVFINASFPLSQDGNSLVLYLVLDYADWLLAIK